MDKASVNNQPLVARRRRPEESIDEHEIEAHEIEAFEEESYEDEYVGEEPQQSGLFGSPGRAMALGVSVLLLLVIGSAIVFLLSTRKPAVAVNDPNIGTGPTVGKYAPDFELLDVRANEALKLSDLRGKPVFLNFWGTWCPPCRAEMPEMQKVMDKHKGNIEMLGISMAPRDQPNGVKQFVDSFNYTWTFVHDDTQQIMLDYQVFSVPSSYFIDKNGIIRSVKIGAFSSAEEIEMYLQQLQ